MVKKLTTPQALPVPVYTCDLEGCDVSRLAHDMINFQVIIGSPGHPDLAAFQCGHDEHWACSIDHFLEIWNACGIEHAQAELIALHSEKEESVHHDDATAKAKAQGTQEEA